MDTQDLHVYMNKEGKFYLSTVAMAAGDMHMPVCTQEMMEVLSASSMPLYTDEIREKVVVLLAERAAAPAREAIAVSEEALQQKVSRENATREQAEKDAAELVARREATAVKVKESVAVKPVPTVTHK